MRKDTSAAKAAASAASKAAPAAHSEAVATKPSEPIVVPSAFAKGETVRRWVEIEKSRGRAYSPGEHPFEIRSGQGTSTGEWENFYSEIEGFTFEDGVRNVVRVQRFDVADPPADAPSQAYVLDMVVESDAATR